MKTKNLKNVKRNYQVEKKIKDALYRNKKDKQLKLIEQIKEFTEIKEVAIKDPNKCINCGLCLSNCPVYLSTRNEMFSPRAKVSIIRALISEESQNNEYKKDKNSISNIDIYEKIKKLDEDDQKLLQKIFYSCTLCGNCTNACPLNLDLKEMFLFMRHALFKTKTITKKMLNTVNTTLNQGNPFEKDKQEFYCC